MEQATPSQNPNQSPYSQVAVSPQVTQPPLHAHIKKNVYPIIRHTILIACVLFTLCLIIFLIHQNGRVIYEKGI